MTLLSLYPYVKMAHIGLALTSGALFALRGLAVLAGARWGMSPGVRHASMGIDTALLVAAVTLLVMAGINPLAVSWLSVKLAVLVAYIVLGTLALRRARGFLAKLLCYAAALFCFALMYSIARRHHPLGFLADWL